MHTWNTAQEGKPWPGQSAEMCRRFLLLKFWRMLPGIFLEEFSAHFSHKTEEKHPTTKSTSKKVVTPKQKSILPTTSPKKPPQTRFHMICLFKSCWYFGEQKICYTQPKCTDSIRKLHLFCVLNLTSMDPPSRRLAQPNLLNPMTDEVALKKPNVLVLHLWGNWGHCKDKWIYTWYL